MAAINPVDLQKKLALVATPTNNTAQAQAPAGGVFGGEFKTRKEGGVEQNTQVFNSLDPQAQEIVKNVIGDKAGASPDKIAAALKAGGYEANVGGAKGSGTEKYLEITGKDGNKYRIWDIGGDNAIGTQDIKFNGALGDFKNELKATVPTNGAATHTAGAAPANAVAPLNATAPT
ncbi:MAG TPA: hypothetical protein DDX14_04185, partial [Cyanobacteria bacterium UBA9579]|nr:hypothetical protein [Cyanobacteria bacterium UBA9579]